MSDAAQLTKLFETGGAAVVPLAASQRGSGGTSANAGGAEAFAAIVAGAGNPAALPDTAAPVRSGIQITRPIITALAGEAGLATPETESSGTGEADLSAAPQVTEPGVADIEIPAATAPSGAATSDETEIDAAPATGSGNGTAGTATPVTAAAASAVGEDAGEASGAGVSGDPVTFSQTAGAPVATETETTTVHKSAEAAPGQDEAAQPDTAQTGTAQADTAQADTGQAGTADPRRETPEVSASAAPGASSTTAGAAIVPVDAGPTTPLRATAPGQATSGAAGGGEAGAGAPGATGKPGGDGANGAPGDGDGAGDGDGGDLAGNDRTAARQAAQGDRAPGRSFTQILGHEFGERSGPQPALSQTPSETPVFASPPETAQSVVRAAFQAGSNLPVLPVRTIAVHMAQRLADGQRDFHIRLDPPALGRIDVRMEIARDGHLTAQLVADRPETLDALQRDARLLERALQTAGLNVDDGALNFQLREHNTGGGTGKEPGGTGGSATDDAEADPAPQLVSLNALDIKV